MHANLFGRPAQMHVDRNGFESDEQAQVCSGLHRDTMHGHELCSRARALKPAAQILSRFDTLYRQKLRELAERTALAAVSAIQNGARVVRSEKLKKSGDRRGRGIVPFNACHTRFDERPVVHPGLQHGIGQHGADMASAVHVRSRRNRVLKLPRDQALERSERYFV